MLDSCHIGSNIIKREVDYNIIAVYQKIKIALISRNGIGCGFKIPVLRFFNILYYSAGDIINTGFFITEQFGKSALFGV